MLRLGSCRFPWAQSATPIAMPLQSVCQSIGQSRAFTLCPHTSASCVPRKRQQLLPKALHDTIMIVTYRIAAMSPKSGTCLTSPQNKQNDATQRMRPCRRTMHVHLYLYAVMARGSWSVCCTAMRRALGRDWDKEKRVAARHKKPACHSSAYACAVMLEHGSRRLIAAGATDQLPQTANKVEGTPRRGGNLLMNYGDTAVLLLLSMGATHTMRSSQSGVTKSPPHPCNCTSSCQIQHAVVTVQHVQHNTTILQIAERWKCRCKGLHHVAARHALSPALPAPPRPTPTSALSPAAACTIKRKGQDWRHARTCVHAQAQHA